MDTSNAGPATITYTIEDAEGNFATATRTVNVLDKKPPEITLLGANKLEINQGDTYIDQNPDVNALDNVDGNISDQVQSTG